MRNAWLATLLVLILSPSSAFAVCSAPSGVAGQLQLVTGKIRYCNDTSWIDTSVATLTSCSGTGAGTITYNSGLQYCDGTNWISMMGPTLSSCAGTTAGTYNYDSAVGHYRVCDGTNWKRMSPAPSGITIATTVARAGGNVANGVAIQSASFTPPDNSLLLVCLNSDTLHSATNDMVASVTDSNSGNWTVAVENDENSGTNSSGTVGGHASFWYTKITTGTSMTVSARRVSGNIGDQGLTFKVYVITGHDTANPIGAIGKNFSTATNNITPNGYTSTFANSRGFGCATDWDAKGAPTSTDVGETNQSLVTVLSYISTYKAANTASAGTIVPFNFDAGGSSGTRWRWAAVEIKPAP